MELLKINVSAMDRAEKVYVMAALEAQGYKADMGGGGYDDYYNKPYWLQSYWNKYLTLSAHSHGFKQHAAKEHILHKGKIKMKPKYGMFKTRVPSTREAASKAMDHLLANGYKVWSSAEFMLDKAHWYSSSSSDGGYITQTEDNQEAHFMSKPLPERVWDGSEFILMYAPVQTMSPDILHAPEPAKAAPAVPTTESALDVQIGGGHYKDMQIQPVEYIYKNNLPFIEGCIVKYISRWRTKNGIQDLKKIKHFVDLLIELEGEADAV